MGRNRVVDDTPNIPSGASDHHTHGEVVAVDRNPVGGRNALGDQKPGEVAAAQRFQC